MLDMMTEQNTISKIAMLMPSALVASYEKKPFYTTEEVATTFASTLESDNNIEYAFAMFCTLPHFVEQSKTLAIEESYNNLRLAVSKKCFGSWPRFNFDSLLDYSKSSTISEAGTIFSGGDGFVDGGSCSGE